VAGVVIIVIVLFIVGPIAVFFGGAIWSALTGWLFSWKGEPEGTEGVEVAS
jgi:hypothetical protein